MTSIRGEFLESRKNSNRSVRGVMRIMRGNIIKIHCIQILNCLRINKIDFKYFSHNMLRLRNN